MPSTPMAAIPVSSVASAMIDQLDFGAVFAIEYGGFCFIEFIQDAATSGRHAGKGLAWAKCHRNRSGAGKAEYSGQK
ncbi:MULTISPECIES: hypothetical protein [Phyllobacteriaceae]|nr:MULTISPECIES: hypothetical protein [Mesorhizobium]MBN9234545.1 hypothetical protein [Mesorhizobium sp.]MDQ0328977.1 hypothetical protein [Mesorhizobium sp. YL-MeA3-2017]